MKITRTGRQIDNVMNLLGKCFARSQAHIGKNFTLKDLVYVQTDRQRYKFAKRLISVLTERQISLGIFQEMSLRTDGQTLFWPMNWLRN